MRDAVGQEAFAQEFEKDHAHKKTRRTAALAAVAGPSSIIVDDPLAANTEVQADMGQVDLDNHMEFDAGNEGLQSPVLSDASMTSNITGPENVPPQPATAHNGHPHEFKTDFHPCSGRKTLLQTYEEFGVASEALKAPPADERPWCPFRSWGDFKFSEIALEAALNQGQVDKLLSLIARIVQGDTHITLKNEADLHMALDNAAAELTLFFKHDIIVPYKKEQRTFQVYARPIWDWALDLLDNLLLAPHFIWDAQRVYKHNSTNFEWFFSEPWTADCWWDIQIRPSSPHTGTVKGYPIMVHCANLPVDIRNGEGIGGGRVVGWLLIIEEEASEHGKPGFINFKCMMSLIRGVQCKCPCPVCLIPLDELSDLSKTFATRTAKDTQDALAVYKCSKTQGEELLKSLGLCAVRVHGGIGGKHLLEELKTIISNLGCEGMELVEKQIAEFPQWQNLNHFATVIHITFTDSNKKHNLVLHSILWTTEVVWKAIAFCMLFAAISSWTA
ncbi:hypothetical protein EDB19DRAFT_1827677 [Suillus lakei]|nr:hypothetical protein EDB19DRAFT_1827677 [Suillus lakei]